MIKLKYTTEVLRVQAYAIAKNQDILDALKEEPQPAPPPRPDQFENISLPQDEQDKKTKEPKKKKESRPKPPYWRLAKVQDAYKNLTESLKDFKDLDNIIKDLDDDELNKEQTNTKEEEEYPFEGKTIESISKEIDEGFKKSQEYIKNLEEDDVKII